jgi:GrpB-like predicted nucleotidyltransferase (UPF0157 family)
VLGEAEAFRDAFRADPETGAAYAALERDLAERHTSDTTIERQTPRCREITR